MLCCLKLLRGASGLETNRDQALLDLVKAFETVPHHKSLEAAMTKGYSLVILRLSLSAYRLMRSDGVDGESVCDAIVRVARLLVPRTTGAQNEHVSYPDTPRATASRGWGGHIPFSPDQCGYKPTSHRDGWAQRSALNRLKTGQDPLTHRRPWGSRGTHTWTHK